MTAALERWGAPVVAALTIGLLAADNGGYFPTAWGWSAGVLLWATAALVAFGRRTDIGWIGVSFVVALALLVAWTALSLFWTASVPATVLEVERALIYLGGVAALVYVARRSDVRRIAACLLVAGFLITLYALGTRLFPNRIGAYDPIATYRLSDPIGYWNGLGIFVVLVTLLALGFAARARGVLVRVLAGASLVFVLPTLYFTFSRGAWAALAIAVVVAHIADRQRLQLATTTIVAAIAPAVAVALAVRSHGLTHAHVPLHEALADGHRLAWRLLVLAIVAVILLTLLCVIEARWAPGRSLRVAYGIALVAVPVVVAIAILVHYGGPRKAVTRAYDTFTAPPTRASIRNPNLNQRLLSLGGNGRAQYWHVAWREYTAHEALGSGAGTYARYWARDRKTGANAQDAHGLYIETLAELGPVGLVLLVAAFLIPFAAFPRARGEPLAAILLAGYVAFVLHAGVDWDRELPAVTLTGLFLGGLLVVAGSSEDRRRPAVPLRIGVALAVACLGTFALYGLIGNAALGASDRDRGNGHFAAAADQARKARTLMPWSPAPWVALGSAQSAAGDRTAAVASFRRAVAKDPGDWSLWYGLASVARGRERAVAVARAVRLNPRGYELQDLRRKVKG